MLGNLFKTSRLGTRTSWSKLFSTKKLRRRPITLPPISRRRLKRQNRAKGHQKLLQKVSRDSQGQGQYSIQALRRRMLVRLTGIAKMALQNSRRENSRRNLRQKKSEWGKKRTKVKHLNSLLLKWSVKKVRFLSNYWRLWLKRSKMLSVQHEKEEAKWLTVWEEGQDQTWLIWLSMKTVQDRKSVDRLSLTFFPMKLWTTMRVWLRRIWQRRIREQLFRSNDLSVP